MRRIVEHSIEVHCSWEQSSEEQTIVAPKMEHYALRKTWTRHTSSEGYCFWGRSFEELMT